MTEPVTQTAVQKVAEKRPASGDTDIPDEKKPRLLSRKKIALLAAYNGKGYYGVQVNKGFPTIESELFPALVKIGAWDQAQMDKPSLAWFQRGSRTDKGVSACGQTFSMNVRLVPDLVNQLNANLPEQIRILGYVKTTKSFDSKNWCDSRTYMYMTPTFAFADIKKFVTEDFRIDPERLDTVRQVLQNFVGTHNFHNFTSGVKYNEKCANRYIIKWDVSEPFVHEGMEFVTLRVKGQSFMLHQIRKMIGITVAIVRGYCGEDLIEKAYGPGHTDIPRAPGLGLVLEELHFTAYNKKWGSDGIHDKIEWEPVREAQAKFKESQIISDIVTQEKADKVMWEWMRTLVFHNFKSEADDDTNDKDTNDQTKVESETEMKVTPTAEPAVKGAGTQSPADGTAEPVTSEQVTGAKSVLENVEKSSENVCETANVSSYVDSNHDSEIKLQESSSR